MEESYKATQDNQRRIADLISSIPVVGQGATSFAQIDQFLTGNPDAQYVRIANGGNTVNQARSYQTPYGAWSDNSSAIVSNNGDDQGARDIFRYVNYSPMTARTGKRGEKATFQDQYQGGQFFSQNGLDYKTDYGMILSRDEYSAFKEGLRTRGAQGLEQLASNPQTPVDAAQERQATTADAAAAGEGGRGVPSILDDGDQLGGAAAEQPGTTIETEGELNKRTLLG